MVNSCHSNSFLLLLTFLYFCLLLPAFSFVVINYHSSLFCFCTIRCFVLLFSWFFLLWGRVIFFQTLKNHWTWSHGYPSNLIIICPMMKFQKFVGPVLIKAVMFEMSYISLVLHFARVWLLFQESMAVDSFGASVVWQRKEDVSEGWKLVKSNHIMLSYQVERVVFLNERGGCLIACSDLVRGWRDPLAVTVFPQRYSCKWPRPNGHHLLRHTFVVLNTTCESWSWGEEGGLESYINREGSACSVSYCVFVRRRKRDEDRHDINKMKGYTLLSEGHSVSIPLLIIFTFGACILDLPSLKLIIS